MDPNQSTVQPTTQPGHIQLLIVEDDFYLCDIYRIQAVDNGLKVDTAADGVEAISKIQAYKPDVILLDIMLPHMDGIALLKQLRKNDEFKNTPVIVATNREDTSTSTEAQALGVTEYILKIHSTPEDIINCVMKYLPKPA